MVDRKTSTFQVGSDPCSIETFAVPAGSGERPAVVLLHGTDGLEGESGTEIPKLAEQIADAGFIVFVPEYFGTHEMPGWPLALIFESRIRSVGSYAPRIAAAVEYACADPRVDRARLGLVGLSLGGGLALQYAVGAGSERVRAVVDFFGYIDAGSSVYRDACKLPPTLILHNKNDGVVDVKYSSDLRDALLAHGIAHEFHGYDDDYSERKFHPFRPGGEADKDSRSRTVTWLEKYVGGTA
ncbi:MAG: dienelactone hydrolase family protein [Amaricoccus sp.]|uniref:dienelactone hydrolase family protein n=1 Tax=Amaricoccus sp. TaxID=1872485 RepID=UPI003314B343